MTERGRRWTWALGAVAAVGAMALGVWAVLAWTQPTSWQELAAPPEEQSTESIVEFVMSDEFGQLPVENRVDYIQRVRRMGPERNVWVTPPTDLTDARRDRLRQNLQPAMERIVDRHVEEYTALPNDKRQAYLDGLIDELSKRAMAAMADAQRRGATIPAGPPGHFTPERLRMRMEDLTPEQRARRAVFMKDMRVRVQQRGLDALNPLKRLEELKKKPK